MFSTFMSVTTLFVSSVSLFLNLKSSAYSVYLSGYSSQIDRQHKRISFTINNTSSHPLVVKRIILKHGNQVVSEIDFDIHKYDRDKADSIEREERKKFRERSDGFWGALAAPDPNMFGSRFIPSLDSTSPIFEKLFSPFEKYTFDTFVDEFPDEIIVITNKRINYLSNLKSFSVQNK